MECVISATEADIMKSLRNESTHLTVITSPATSLFYGFVIVNRLFKSSTVSSAHHISNLVDRFALYNKVIKRVYTSNVYTTNYVFTTTTSKSIVTEALCFKPWLIVIRTFGMHWCALPQMRINFGKVIQIRRQYQLRCITIDHKEPPMKKFPRSSEKREEEINLLVTCQ